MTVRMRHTKSHRNKRRSHHALEAKTLSKCSHCGMEKLSHVACRNCGYYGERQVLDVFKKLDKKERKKKEKELAETEEKTQKPLDAAELSNT